LNAEIINLGISGGHLNPSITLTQLMLFNMKPLEGTLYMLAQVVGAFTGQLFSQIITNKHVTPIIDMADKEILLNVVFSEFIAVNYQ
jgi:glycerol uptake facilitator-like aquaporin